MYESFYVVAEGYGIINRGDALFVLHASHDSRVCLIEFVGKCLVAVGQRLELRGKSVNVVEERGEGIVVDIRQCEVIP